MLRDAEYLELPMSGSLELPAVVRTDDLDLKPSEDGVFWQYGSPAQPSRCRLFSGTWASLNGL